MASSMPQTCIDNCWLGHCSPLPRWKLIIASFHPLEGRCEKIGRASLLASHRPSKSLPQEARREPRPPISAGFEFFHTFRGVGGCPCRKLEAPPRPSGRLPCLINDSSEDLRYSCPFAF